MEAISHAGTCLGILANDGIVLAAENRNVHKLLDENVAHEKIYKLHEYENCLLCTEAGTGRRRLGHRVHYPRLEPLSGLP